MPDSYRLLFSDMEDKGRKEIVNERFKFELGDEELEMLKDMGTLDQDKYNHGHRVGKAEGIAEGKIDSMVEGVIFYRNEMGITVDEALSRYPIPDEYRSEVEKKVRRTRV